MACGRFREPQWAALAGGVRKKSIDANGRGERIRTSDPLNPIEVRYQAALRPDMFNSQFPWTGPAPGKGWQ